MGIEQAGEALEAGLQGEGSADLAPQGQGAGQPDQGQTPFDLDKATKFMWKGKEWTPSQLEKGHMLHSDYTKKTQAVSERAKYFDNLDADLDKVRGNPQLASEFQKVYPKEFHKYLGYVMKEEANGGSSKGPTEQLPAELQNALSRIDKFEQYVQTKEIQAKEQEIENISMRMTQKYPEAIEDVVLARAQVLLDEGVEINEGVWEKLYKKSHEMMVQRDQQRKTKTFEAQKTANTQGRGIGKGGGTPGSAPKRMTMEEATQAAIRDHQKK